MQTTGRVGFTGSLLNVLEFSKIFKREYTDYKSIYHLKNYSKSELDSYEKYRKKKI